jgi:hypothetical protein
MRPVRCSRERSNGATEKATTTYGSSRSSSGTAASRSSSVGRPRRHAARVGASLALTRRIDRRHGGLRNRRTRSPCAAAPTRVDPRREPVKSMPSAGKVRRSSRTQPRWTNCSKVRRDRDPPFDARPRRCQSHFVKSCGPLGSQDLALLAEPEGRPPPFLGVHPYHGIAAATGRNPRQRFWLALVSGSSSAAGKTRCRKLEGRVASTRPQTVLRP